LIAIHINDPKDIPARIEMRFSNQQECQQALNSLTYWVKFENFKIEGKCIKQS